MWKFDRKRHNLLGGRNNSKVERRTHIDYVYRMESIYSTSVELEQSWTRCKKSPSLASLTSLSSVNATDVDTAVCKRHTVSLGATTISCNMNQSIDESLYSPIVQLHK